MWGVMARRTLYFDERRLNPACMDVLQAAALLEITEFELFRSAYRWWHGHDVREQELEESYFVPYMFQERVPSWVRQFAREVVAEDEADRLDPARYGVHPKEFSKSLFDRGLRYCLWLVVILGMFVTMIAAYEELAPWASSCYLPPCY